MAEAAVETVRSEADVLRTIAAGRGDAAYGQLFLVLLDERHAVYAGMDPATITRVRGALIHALADRGLSPAAERFVLAELESAYDPWLTAVCAAALRRRPAPAPDHVQPLLEAILYVGQRDDQIRLDCYGGYGDAGEPTTAVTEILRTLAWLGACGQSALPRLRELATTMVGEVNRDALAAAVAAIEADPQATVEPGCPPIVVVDRALPPELAGSRLQDHAERELSFKEFFVGAPTVVVFFFTRCGNPAKCPLTVSRLGHLQSRLVAEGHAIRTAAFTYDPAYDIPRRMAQYARSWGARLGEEHRFFRTLDDPEPLRAFFDLGASYGPAGVTQHQLEAFVLDRRATIVRAVRRRRWDEAELLAAAASL